MRASFHAGTEVQGLASLAVVPDKHAVHRRLAAMLNTPCWVLVDASIIHAFVWKYGIYHVYIYTYTLSYIIIYPNGHFSGEKDDRPSRVKLCGSHFCLDGFESKGHLGDVLPVIMKVASGADDPYRQVMCIFRGWHASFKIGLWACKHSKLTVWFYTFLIVRLAFPQSVHLCAFPFSKWITER